MPNIRKSPTEKKLAGNPGKRPITETTVKPKGALAPPKIMSAGAHSVWTRLVNAMPPGVYAITDQALLAAYCEQVAIHEQCVAALANTAANPLVTLGSQQQLVVSPYVKVMNEAVRLMATLGARLHLDPISRQAINAPGSDEEDEFSPPSVRH